MKYNINNNNNNNNNNNINNNNNNNNNSLYLYTVKKINDGYTTDVSVCHNYQIRTICLFDYLF